MLKKEQNKHLCYCYCQLPLLPASVLQRQFHFIFLFNFSAFILYICKSLNNTSFYFVMKHLTVSVWTVLLKRLIFHGLYIRYIPRYTAIDLYLNLSLCFHPIIFLWFHPAIFLCCLDQHGQILNHEHLSFSSCFLGNEVLFSSDEVS